MFANDTTKETYPLMRCAMTSKVVIQEDGYDDGPNGAEKPVAEMVGRWCMKWEMIYTHYEIEWFRESTLRLLGETSLSRRDGMMNPGIPLIGRAQGS